LQEGLPGLAWLRLLPYGQDGRVLKASFENQSPDGAQVTRSEFFLNELSEGQRALIVLYSFFGVLKLSGGAWTLCIDEPDSFVSLREIQPWLHALMDSIETSKLQALLVSHHPELINPLAKDHGLWIERVKGGPARAMPIAEDGTGLSPSELVARGWVNA
jgi:predicted ATPase